MKLRHLILFLTVFIGVAFAQENPGAEAKHPDDKAHAEEKANPNEIYWKWANFAILAAVLGYLANKNLGVFFATRSADIQKHITEAAAVKADAEKRAGEIEKRFANLEVEIERLRRDSREEMHRESERIEAETAQLAAKIHSQAEQEIAGLTTLAKQELRAYSADLALQLAEDEVKRQLNPDVQKQLINRFGGELSRLRSVH